MSEGQPATWEHLRQRIATLEAEHAELAQLVRAQANALDLQHTMLKQLTAMAELQMMFMRTVKEIIYQ